MDEGTDFDRFTTDVRTEIDAITDFPDQAEDPVVKQLGRTDFVASVAVTGAASKPDLKAYAEELKDRMLRFGGIPKIDIKGFSDHQIRIELPDEVIRQYGYQHFRRGPRHPAPEPRPAVRHAADRQPGFADPHRR